MSQAHEPVLVYERIAANRRNTVLFLALFGILVALVAAYLAMYLAFIVFMFLSPSAQDLSQNQWRAMALPLLVSTIALLALMVSRYRHAAETALRFLGARPLAREEAQELWRTLENLCIGAGLPMPRLYLLEEAAPNAFAVGLDPERASLAVTRGMLALLDRRELEGVMAHELSHIGNDDIQLDTAVAVMLRTIRLPKPIAGMLLIGLVVTLIELPSLLFHDGQGKIEWIWLWLWLIPLYVLSWPLLGRFIQRAVSRQREFRADADAVLLTRNPEGLARALAKIAAAPQPEICKSGAMAHLFLVEPQQPGWLRLGLSTHPPVSERIDLLARMGTGIPPSVLEEASRVGAGFAYIPVKVEILPPAAEKAITLLEAAIQGIAVGVAVFVAAFILNVLLQAGKGGMEQLSYLLQWFGGVGAAIAFVVAAYRVGLRGWRLWLALGFAIGYLPYMGFFLLPDTQDPMTARRPGGDLWALVIEFIRAGGLILVTGAAGAIIGSKEFRNKLREIIKTLSGRSQR